MQSRHKQSVLLNPEENAAIFSTLSRSETALSTAVIQLLLSCSPNHKNWQLFGTGVMCFVKHNIKRSYYFRLYDFESKRVLWEQEIYLDIDYMSPEPCFHSFEADHCMAGLNFADQRDANQFLNVVNEKSKLIQKMFKQFEKQRNSENMDKDCNSIENKNNFSLEVPKVSPIKSHSLEVLPNAKRFSFRIKSTKNSKPKPKISKLEIGMPTNFKHIQHIGWSPTTGFDFNVIDPKLDNFFRMAGISADQLDDSNTRKFIFDFIDTHGGIEAAIQEVPKPDKNIKSDDEKEVKHEVNKTAFSEQKLPRPISRSPSDLPPPPPPPPPPLLTVLTQKSDNLEKSKPIESSVSTNSNTILAENDCGRNALLEQIRDGISLKKTKTIKNQIKSSTSVAAKSGNPLANALSQALENRFRVNQMNDCLSDDSDTNCDNDINEWSD